MLKKLQNSSGRQKKKRLIIHVGLPKCASTSLQEALSVSSEIFFPNIGLNQYEHLCIPLYLRGVDKWTSQWYSTEWAEENFEKLCTTVNSFDDHNLPVVLSSERLADLRLVDVRKLVKFFKNYEVEFLCLVRGKASFVRSLWRHLIFRHDYSESFQVFSKKYENFDPFIFQKRISDEFKVNVVTIDDKNWVNQVEEILSCSLEISYENVSAPFECCFELQRVHEIVGSSKFKSFFTPEMKSNFALLLVDNVDRIIDPFDVPVFKQP